MDGDTAGRVVRGGRDERSPTGRPRTVGSLRVLMLSRAYPNAVFPNLGLWVERPTALMNRRADIEVRVVAPEPYSPPLPRLCPLWHYARFRHIGRSEELNGVEVLRPRYLAGPGRSTYAIDSRA